MVVKRFLRVAKHLIPGYLHLVWHLPGDANERIKSAVAEAEKGHLGEIRVVVETRRPIHKVLRGETPRGRALEVFGIERVWDTEKNIGVLLYVQLAERDAEIIADRGLNGAVTSEEWQRVCIELERVVREKGFAKGVCDAVECIGGILRQRLPLPSGVEKRNEIPDLVAIK